MKNILKSPFIKNIGDIAYIMFEKGWDERNAGNISCLLKDEEVKQYVNTKKVLRTYNLDITADKNIIGRYFLFTGTGKYFLNVKKDPAENLGIIRITEDGKHAELVWGFSDGGRCTSELSAHLMAHSTRLKVDSEHSVVIHSHPTYTLSMCDVCPPDEKDFTHRLWYSHTEGIAVFPEGVGVLPTMVCGTPEIAELTAEKLKSHLLVVWTNHGIYGTGRTLDDAFGLIDTVEKAATIYMVKAPFKDAKVVPDEILLALARHYNVEPWEGVLSVK